MGQLVGRLIWDEDIVRVRVPSSLFLGDVYMICETCGKEHDGSYGSGRFCCQACARSFSTSKNRKEINQKISNSIKNSDKVSHISKLL